MKIFFNAIACYSSWIRIVLFLIALRMVFPSDHATGEAFIDEHFLVPLAP
ncbi:MAG TPA: hypothetical protein VGP83_07180 [Pyrinomonadaceae bacterium]|jgi:hypothetical protein|nr:hypothetical protein [Pyrinomonadaceae bacterium]